MGPKHLQKIWVSGLQRKIAHTYRYPDNSKVYFYVVTELHLLRKDKALIKTQKASREIIPCLATTFNLRMASRNCELPLPRSQGFGYIRRARLLELDDAVLTGATA